MSIVIEVSLDVPRSDVFKRADRDWRALRRQFLREITRLSAESPGGNR